MSSPPFVPSSKVELPTHLPVMFLPDAVLLPGFMMPLLIFEARYRAMLTFALEHDRMFCVAHLKPEVREVHGRHDFFPICGAGLVRACVGHDNGTSHLVLQGMTRVEIVSISEEKPFRLAKLRELAPGPQGETVPSLASELRRWCVRVPLEDGLDQQKLAEQIAAVSDPGLLADLVARAYLRAPERQQAVLEEVEIDDRLRAVTRHLREEYSL